MTSCLTPAAHSLAQPISCWIRIGWNIKYVHQWRLNESFIFMNLEIEFVYLEWTQEEMAKERATWSGKEGWDLTNELPDSTYSSTGMLAKVLALWVELVLDSQTKVKSSYDGYYEYTVISETLQSIVRSFLCENLSKKREKRWSHKMPLYFCLHRNKVRSWDAAAGGAQSSYIYVRDDKTSRDEFR